MSSSQYGHLVESIAVSEVSKFFSNRGAPAKIFFIRSKEKVEVDLLIELPNNRYIAAEIKLTPQALDEKQHKLIDSLGLHVIERWVMTPTSGATLPLVKVVEFKNIWKELNKIF